MASVAKQILAKLHARLVAIDGTGAFVNNIGDRVEKRRPRYDVDADTLPILFIYRRTGGDTREVKPTDPHADVTLVFDVVGLVAVGADSGDAAEDLLADVTRALELASDVYLHEGSIGRNLLSQELMLVSADAEPAPPGSKVEVVAVGVRCIYPRKYGDPDHVI